MACFTSTGSQIIKVYNPSSASWTTSFTGTQASAQIRFVNFAARTVRVSGLEGSVVAWNGNGDTSGYWSASGNPINPQQLWYVNGDTNTGYLRPKFTEVYKSRVYIGGDSVNPDRLYFSSVITSAGNITWAPSTDFVDINPSDGDNMTALKRFSLELLVFKTNYIYRFRTTGVDPDPLVRVGTRSQESIIEGERGMYFHHDTGFYRYTGGYPEKISEPIKDIVDAITYSNYSLVSGWKTPDHVFWSVGNLTVDGQSWKNVVLRYTESSQIWTAYSYGARVLYGSDYNSSSSQSLTRVVGLDNGAVATVDSGTTDLGEPINYRMITKWYEEEISTRKVISMLISICEKAQGMAIMYQKDDETTWKPVGQITKYLDYFDGIKLQFHRIRFKVTGSSRLEAPIFRGLEWISGINDGVVKE